MIKVHIHQQTYNLIAKKLKKNEALTIHESNTWCEALNNEFNLIQLKEYIDKIPIHQLTKKRCNDYIFSQLMYTYSTDLSFTSNQYFRGNNKQFAKNDEDKISKRMQEYREQQHQNDFFDKTLWNNFVKYLSDVGLIVYLDKQTIDSEKIILDKFAEEWDAVISKGYHKDECLQSVTEEAIYTRKQVKRDFKSEKINPIQKDNQLRLNLWKTKWNFILAREIVELIEETEPFPVNLTLKGKISYTISKVLHIFLTDITDNMGLSIIFFQIKIFIPLKLYRRKST